MRSSKNPPDSNHFLCRWFLTINYLYIFLLCNEFKNQPRGGWITTQIIQLALSLSLSPSRRIVPGIFHLVDASIQKHHLVRPVRQTLRHSQGNYIISLTLRWILYDIIILFYFISFLVFSDAEFHMNMDGKKVGVEKTFTISAIAIRNT